MGGSSCRRRPPSATLVLLLHVHLSCVRGWQLAAASSGLSPRGASSVQRAAVAIPVMQMEWEELESGCMLLRTPQGVPPRGLVHFLGGLLVSPSPHNAYRYLLENLSGRGYLVLATPYEVDFDYRVPAATVHGKFVRAKTSLIQEYGELSQMAMGHSLGALMQVLFCCTYKEYVDECAAAAMLSFNNMPASDAISAYEQVVVPAAALLEPLTNELPAALKSVRELRDFGFEALRAGLQLNPFGDLAPPATREAAAAALRDAEALASLTDQIPNVLAQISRGVSEFSPAPDEMRSLVGSSVVRLPAPSLMSASCPPHGKNALSSASRLAPPPPAMAPS